jgi:hypothetical protein
MPCNLISFFGCNILYSVQKHHNQRDLDPRININKKNYRVVAKRGSTMAINHHGLSGLTSH